ncbi:hypothetical protein NG99_17005 [Erwinia typographi]|uniref:Uncharacterized protein n=1 Tax=Erwinia typographi TaxID=371042 RepID=A0A0A3Z0H1_9GAMM|nr:hypothetical protein [Erwinia typographi]KGT91264.1 hypothetical protein NG99_17005 [Erwinia typographi]
MLNILTTPSNKNEPDATTAFDIHLKLKASKSHWSYYFAAQPHQKNAKYELCTNFVGVISFALYEKIDNGFVLVDFFEDIKDACPDAIKILDEHPEAKAAILGSMFHARNQ